MKISNIDYNTREEAIATLALALRYLENPEVRAIPFALHVDAIAQRVREVLEKLRKESKSWSNA